MYLLKIDAIKAGNVGDGIRGWGDDGKQTSHVRVQAVNTIAQKMPCGRFVRYTGFRQGYVLESVMDKYIARFQELASDDVPATMLSCMQGKQLSGGAPVEAVCFASIKGPLIDYHFDAWHQCAKFPRRKSRMHYSNRSCLNNPEVFDDYDIHYLLYLQSQATAYACAMNESSYMQSSA